MNDEQPAGTVATPATPQTTPDNSPEPLSTNSIIKSLTTVFSGETADPATPGQESPPAPAPAATTPPAPPATPKNEDDEDGALPPELQARIDRRIGKEVAKRKELERQLEEARSQIAKPPANGKAPEAAKPAPADEHPEMKAAREAEADAQNVIQWSKRLSRMLNHDADAVAAELQRSQIALDDTSPEAIGNWLERVREGAQETLQKALVKKEVLTNRLADQDAQQRAHFDAMANESFPWWNDPASPQYADAQKVQNVLPVLKEKPQGKLWTGIILMGLEAFQNAQKAKGKPAAPAAPAQPPKPRVPTVQLPATTRLPNTPSGDPAANGEAAKVKFFNTGDPKAKQEWVKSLLGAAA